MGMTRHAVLSRTFANVLGRRSTLSARSHQGFNSRLKGVARELAVVIGISLSMALMPRLEASIVPTKSLKALANYQLTDKQYQCHNEIVHIESRWKIDAVGNLSGTKGLMVTIRLSLSQSKASLMIINPDIS